MTTTAMHVIPDELRPLTKRLECLPDLSPSELESILFVVRLGDILHRSFFGTFLTLSLVSNLCNHLHIPDLNLEIGVFDLKWSYRQGEVAVNHRITYDYDMQTVFVLTKIARAVLNDDIAVTDGLSLITEHENKQDCNKIEQGYRDFPGRALVIPLMSFTCATVYFGGTWYDMGFSCAAGVAAAIVAWVVARHDQLTGVMDYFVAILVAMVSVASITAFPESTCFAAQVMGTLYWFFYGTSFVLSLYEITNNQLITGISRFMQSTIRSYGLAFGALFGVWLSWFAPEDRLEQILDKCDTKDSQITGRWFILLFPLSAISCLMQFRVSLRHFVLCLIVQTIAYGSQYLIGTTWDQPEFVANLSAAYLATLASQVAISVLYWFRVSTLYSSQFPTPKHQQPQEQQQGDEEIQQQTLSNEGSIYLSSSQKEATSNGFEAGENSLHHQDLPIPEMSKDDSSNNFQRRSHLVESNDLLETNENDTHNGRHQRQSTESTSQNSIIVGFTDATAGYMANDELAFARSNIWFCLMPALYLLVPGSKMLQAAFMSLLGSLVEEEAGYAALASSLIVIGLGQVIGLRLGFITLWLCGSIRRWIQERWCSFGKGNDDRVKGKGSAWNRN